MTSHPGLVSFPPSVAPPSAALAPRLFHFDNSATITLDFLDRPTPGITRYRYRMELDGEGQGSKVKKVKDEFERRVMDQEQTKPKYKKPFAKARQGQLSRSSSSQEENFGRKADDRNVNVPERGKEPFPGSVDAEETPRPPETKLEKKDGFTSDVFAETPLLRSPNLLLRRNSKETASAKKTNNATERAKSGSNQSVSSEADSILSNSMLDGVWAMEGVPLDALCRDLLKDPVPSSREMDELVAKNRNRSRDKNNEIYSQSESNSPKIDAVTKRTQSVVSAPLKRKMSKQKATNGTQNTEAKCESDVPVNSEVFAVDSRMLRVLPGQRSESGSMDENNLTTKRFSDELCSSTVIESNKTGLKTNAYDTVGNSHVHSRQSRDFEGLQHCPIGTEISEDQKKSQKCQKNAPEKTANDSTKEIVTKTLPCPGSSQGNSHLTSQRKTMTPISVDSEGKPFSIGDGCDEVFDMDCISLPSCSSPPADEIERSRLRLSSPTHCVKTSISNADSHQASPAPQNTRRSAAAESAVPGVKVDNTTRQGQGQGQEPKVKGRVDKTNNARDNQDGNLREKEGRKKRNSSRVESLQRSRSSDRTLRRSWIQVAKTVEIQLPRRSRSTSKTRKKSLNKEYDVVTVTTTTEETRTIPKLSPGVGSAPPGGCSNEGAKREAYSHVTEKKFEILPESRVAATTVVRDILPNCGVDGNKDERERLERFQRQTAEKTDVNVHGKATDPKDEMVRCAAKPLERQNSKTIVHLRLKNNHRDDDDGLRVKVIEQHRKAIEIQPNSGTRVERFSVNDTARLHFQVSELLERENPGEDGGSSTRTRDEANELCNRVNELDSQMNGLAQELKAFDSVDSDETHVFTCDQPPTRKSASIDDSDDSGSLGGRIEVVHTAQNTGDVFTARQLNDETVQKDDQAPRFSCTLIVSAVHALDLPSGRRDKVNNSRNVSDIQTVRENTNKVSIATKSREYRIAAIDESQKIESENETEVSREDNIQNSDSSDGRTSKGMHAVRDRDRDKYNRSAESTTQIRRHQNGIEDTRKEVETDTVSPTTGNFAKKRVEFSEKEKQKPKPMASAEFSDENYYRESLREDEKRKAENRIRSSFVVSAEHRFDLNAKSKTREKFTKIKTNQVTSNDVESQAEIFARDYVKDTVNNYDDADLSRRGVLIETPIENAGNLPDDAAEDLDSPENDQIITRFVSEAINTACKRTMQVVLSGSDGGSRDEEDSTGNRANRTSSSKFFDSIFIPAVTRCSNGETAANFQITGVAPVGCAGITGNVNPCEMTMEQSSGSGFEVRDKHISESFLSIGAAASVDVPATDAAVETEISSVSQVENASVNFEAFSRRSSSSHYSSFFKRIFRENSGDDSHTDDQIIPANATARDSAYDHVLTDRHTQRTASDVHEGETELDAGRVEVSVATLSMDSTHDEAVAACDNSVGTNSSKSETVLPENKRSTASLTLVKSAEVNTRLVSQISTSVEEGNGVEYRGPCTSSSSVSYRMIVPIAGSDEAQSRREQITAQLGRTNPEQIYTTVLSKRVPVATPKPTVYFIGCKETEMSRVVEISRDKIFTVNMDSVPGNDVEMPHATEISTFVMMSSQANKGEIESCTGDSFVPSNDSEISSELEENTVETIEDSFDSSDNSDFSALETYRGADSSIQSIESIEEDSIERCNGVIQIYEQEDSAGILSMQSSDFAGNNEDNEQENSDLLNYELRESIEIAADTESKNTPATSFNIWQETIEANSTDFYDENEAFSLSRGHNYDEESKEISNDVRCDVNFRYATELTDNFGENDEEQLYCKVTSFGDDVVTTETQITVMNDDFLAANDWNFAEMAMHSQDGQHQIITDDPSMIAMELHDVAGVERELDNDNASLQDSDELDETLKSRHRTDRLQAINSQEIYSEESDTIQNDGDFSTMDLCVEPGLETLSSAQGNQRLEELFTYEISEDDDREKVIPEEREGFDIRYFDDENLTCDVDDVYTDEFYEATSEYLIEQRRRETESYETNQTGSDEHGEFTRTWTVEDKTEADPSKEKNDKESDNDSDWETEETGFTETKWQTIQYSFDSKEKATESEQRRENEAKKDDDRPDDYMVSYEYGEMYSVFREVPYSIEGLRDTVLYNFNNSPSMKRLLARFPSLRPGTWKFASAAQEMEPEIRSTEAEVRTVEHLDSVSLVTQFVPDFQNDEFLTL